MGLAVTLNGVWKCVGSKWLHRVVELAAVDGPARITAHLYNARVLPTFGYVAQLFPIPRAIRCREGWA
eukprot:5295337-Pyramimonas_sp.AAC.1